jgi:lysozyme
MNRELLITHLIRDESLEQMVYRCTGGKLTIGVGRNLEDVGLSLDECMYLLNNDIDRVTRECKMFSWFNDLTENRQMVIFNMMFNLGRPRFLTFKRAIEAIEQRRWDEAAKEFKDSLWYEQVGDRADRIINLWNKG